MIPFPISFVCTFFMGKGRKEKLRREEQVSKVSWTLILHENFPNGSDTRSRKKRKRNLIEGLSFREI